MDDGGAWASDRAGGVRTRSGRGEFVFLADEYERKSDCTKQSTDGVSAVSEPDMSLKREVGRIDCEKEGGEPGADSSHSGEEDDNGTDPFHQALVNMMIAAAMIRGPAV